MLKAYEINGYEWMVGMKRTWCHPQLSVCPTWMRALRLAAQPEPDMSRDWWRPSLRTLM